MFSAGYPYGPKGQDNLAQGLPWVSQKNVFSPERAPGWVCHNCGRKTVLALPSGPFRAAEVHAKHVFVPGYYRAVPPGQIRPPADPCSPTPRSDFSLLGFDALRQSSSICFASDEPGRLKHCVRASLAIATVYSPAAIKNRGRRRERLSNPPAQGR